MKKQINKLKQNIGNISELTMKQEIYDVTREEYNVKITVLNNYQYEKLGLMDKVFKPNDISSILSSHIYEVDELYALSSTADKCFKFQANNRNGAKERPHGDDMGLLPVMNYTELINYLKINNLPINIINSKIEFGTYIDDAVPNNLRTKLEKLYNEDALLKTNNNYKLFGSNVILPEVIYNDKYYARLQLSSDIFDINISLINGVPTKISDFWLEDNMVVWFEVKSLYWKIYKNENIVLSEKIIQSFLGNVREKYANYHKKYFGNFENSEPYQYLNDDFAKEMLYHIDEMRTKKHENIESDSNNLSNEVGYLKMLREWLLQFPTPEKPKILKRNRKI